MSAHAPDPRARRTRSALEAALRELIAERELSQISVSDLTRRAGVDRSTFYEHYSGVDDLAAAACTAVFDELVSTVSQSVLHATPADRQPGAKALPRLFAHVAEHAPLYRALLGADGSARVINHLFQRIEIAAHASRVGAEIGSSIQADLADLPHDPFAAFVAGALLGTVIDWLRCDCPGTPEQISEAIRPRLAAGIKGTGWAVMERPVTS